METAYEDDEEYKYVTNEVSEKYIGTVVDKIPIFYLRFYDSMI